MENVLVYQESTLVVHILKQWDRAVTWFELLQFIKDNAGDYENLAGPRARHKPPWDAVTPFKWQMLVDQARPAVTGEGATLSTQELNWGIPMASMCRKDSCQDIGDGRLWSSTLQGVYHAASRWWSRVYPLARLRQCSLRRGCFGQKIVTAAQEGTACGVTEQVHQAALLLLAQGTVGEHDGVLRFSGEQAAYPAWSQLRSWLSSQVMPRTPVTYSEDPFNIAPDGLVLDASSDDPVSGHSPRASGVAAPPPLAAAAGPAVGPGQLPTDIVVAAPALTPSSESLTQFPALGILSAAGIRFVDGQPTLTGLVPARPLPDDLGDSMTMSKWCQDLMRGAERLPANDQCTSQEEVELACFCSVACMQTALWGSDNPDVKCLDWMLKEVVLTCERESDNGGRVLSTMDGQPILARLLPPWQPPGSEVETLGPFVQWPCAGLEGTPKSLGGGRLDTTTLRWVRKKVAENMGLFLAPPLQTEPLFGQTEALGEAHRDFVRGLVVDDFFFTHLANCEYSYFPLPPDKKQRIFNNPLLSWGEESWQTTSVDRQKPCDEYPGYAFMQFESKNYRRHFKRIKMWEMDVMLVPINYNKIHWILGVVDFKGTTIVILDSLGGAHPLAVAILARWVVDYSNWEGPVRGLKGKTHKKDVPQAGAW